MKDLTGQKFGKWLAIKCVGSRLAPGRKTGQRHWLCRCECGKEMEMPAYQLTHLTNGCRGCHLTKHGMSFTKEYRAWISMKSRCYGSGFQPWHRDRGIRVCQEWIDSFESFFNHIGPAPSPIHQVDRINNDGHYEFGNVRWATPKENSNNRRVSQRKECRENASTIC